MIRYCLICVFLCTGFSGKTEIPVSIYYADSIFNTGNYSLAAMEYERVYFLSENDSEKTEALLKKSYCYKGLSQYSNATSVLNRIELGSLSDSLMYTIRYEKALNSFLAGNYSQAELFLYEIHYYVNKTSLLKKCLFLEILTKNELMEWDEADSLFQQYLSLHNITIDSAELKALLTRPKLINPSTTKIMSLIIPGSGQMMSGHIFRGLTSIVFEGGSAAFTYLSIKNGFYFSGLTTGIGMFQMFYLGGARYASHLAEKKNAEKISEHNKAIRDFILTKESSLH